MADWTPKDWAALVLTELSQMTGKTMDTSNNIANLIGMMQGESLGQQGGFLRDNNPMNYDTWGSSHGPSPIAAKYGGHIVQEFGIYVMVFPSPEAGAKALADFIKSDEGSVLNALSTNADASTFGTALSNSGWSSAGYANASSFPGYVSAGATAANSPAPAGDFAGPGGAGGTLSASASRQPSGYGGPEPGLLGINRQYSGPGAYKGFDLESLSPELRPEAERAIDQFLSQPGMEQTVMRDVYQNYSEDAWAASIPEVRTLLVVGSVLGWANDPNLFQGQLERTDWWRTHNENQRAWEQTIATDPAQARQAVAEAESRVTNIANELGVQLPHQLLVSIATKVASNSVSQSGVYSATQMADQQIYQMVAAHFNAQAFGAQVSATAKPGSAGVPARGVAAQLEDSFRTIAREYYLPLSPQEIARYVQRYLNADTGEPDFLSGAVAGFTQTAQQMARTLYPALANIIGTTDSSGSDNTPFAALAGYRSLIAQYTGYGGDPGTINLATPQWSWLLTGKLPASVTPSAKAPATASTATGATPNAVTGPPPSGGPKPPGGGGSLNQSTATLPTYDEVQQYLMAQPQFQTTDLAKQMGWHVGTQILNAFGFKG